MDPTLLAGLLSFLPSIIGGLFGDPNKKLRQQLNRLASPQHLQKLTAQNYQSQIGSPAFSQGQATIAAGANQASNQVAQNLAQRGIGTTGTAAVLSGLTPSLVGSQMAGLRTAAHQTAEQNAQQQIKQQIAALTGTQGPSPAQSLFAGGLEAFLPFLQQYLMRPKVGQLPYYSLAQAAAEPYQPPARRP